MQFSSIECATFVIYLSICELFGGFDPFIFSLVIFQLLPDSQDILSK